MIRLFRAYFPVRTLLLGVSEGILIVLTFVLAALVRFDAGGRLVLRDEYAFARIAVVAGVFMLCMYYFDLYDTFVMANRREILSRVVQVLGGGTIVLALIYYTYPQVKLGGGILLVGLFLLLVFLPFWRKYFLRCARSLALAQRVLIVGSSSLASALHEEVQKRPELGMNLVGYVDVAENGGVADLPYLGDVHTLPDLVQRKKVDQVIVAMADRRGRLPLEHLLALKVAGKTVVLDAADVYEKVTGRIPLDFLRASWLVFAPGFQFSGLLEFYKRLFSLAGSIVGLTVSLPLMAVIAAVIKLDSQGPVIFKQRRVGKGGKVFTLFKFRSMHFGCDRDGKPRPAEENDARFTRVGCWLRRTRLDELPQLYNILKGEMDFVGPRPFPPSLEENFARQIPFYSQRWSVKPGATGWAQVQGGYCATLGDNKHKFSYDLFYIKNRSLGLDLLILMQTVKILLWGRGAR